jgi:hypothetical protein
VKKFFSVLLVVILLIVLFVACGYNGDLVHLQRYNEAAKLFTDAKDISFTATYEWRILLNCEEVQNDFFTEEKWQHVSGELFFQRVNWVETVVVWEIVSGWQQVALGEPDRLPLARFDIDIEGELGEDDVPPPTIITKIINPQEVRVTCENLLETRLSHFNLAMGGVCRGSYHEGQTRQTTGGQKSSIVAYFISSNFTGRFMPLHSCDSTTVDRRNNVIFDYENIRRKEEYNLSITQNEGKLIFAIADVLTILPVRIAGLWQGMVVQEVNFTAVFV